MRIAAVVWKMMAGALVLSALVLLAACGGDDSSSGARFDGPTEGSAPADGSIAIEALPATRLIIRDAQLDLEVGSIVEAVEDARAVAERVGGRMDASRIVGSEPDAKYGSVTLRVPSASFDAVVEQLRTFGRLLSEQSSSADVTEEYVDLEARRGNLEATSKRLQEFLDRAGSVQDLLAVQRELTATRGEIERLTGRINLLSAQVSESTIMVDLQEIGVEPPITGDGWRPGETLADAARVLVSVLRVLGDLAIVLGVFSPLIAAAIAVVWVGRRLWLRYAPRRSDSESATADASDAPDVTFPLDE